MWFLYDRVKKKILRMQITFINESRMLRIVGGMDIYINIAVMSHQEISFVQIFYILCKYVHTIKYRQQNTK